MWPERSIEEVIFKPDPDDDSHAKISIKRIPARGMTSAKALG